MSDATSAVLADVNNADRTSPFDAAFDHHDSVSPSGGHENEREVLNDSTPTTISGRYKNANPAEVGGAAGAE